MAEDKKDFVKKIKVRKIGDLIAAEYNPRSLSDQQFETISDSLKRFGFVDPVLVNTHPERKDIIIGGHQRTKVAKSLGYTEVPTIELNLTLAQEKELNIRLNKNTGSWDEAALIEFFNEDELSDWGFSIEDLEFFEPEDMPPPPIDGLTPEEKLEKYLNKDFLDITLPFNKDDYDKVLGVFENLISGGVCEDYSGAVMHLISLAD